MTLAAEALNKLQIDRLDKQMKEHLDAKQKFHESAQNVVMERMHTMIHAHMDTTSKAAPAVKLEPMIKLVGPAAKLVIKVVGPAPKGKFLHRVGASIKKVQEQQRIKKTKKLDISKSRGSVSVQMSEGQNCL